MAIIETQTIESINDQDINQLSSKTLIRSFGQSNDSIEMTIFDQNGQILLIDEFFNDYTPYYDTPSTTTDKSKITSIDIDFEQVLQDYGYNSGTYVMNFSFQRRILTKGLKKLFYISEISPSRREIRIKSDTLNSNSFTRAINDLSRVLNQSNFIKDINLTFGRGTTLLALNASLDKDGTGLIKLYNPLPGNLGINSRFRVFEEIINPLEVTVQTNNTQTGTDIGIDIGAPNFTLSNEDIFTVPSGYKTFDQILTNGAASSSFNNIQGLLSGSSVQIDLEFDNIDTPSGYHFENFIHFSSATERLQNFKYKLGLLQSYSSSLAQLNNITGSVSSSNFITENRSILEAKENKLLQSFDYYERYLYYESGAFAWPKTNDSLPFINAKTESADAVSWFGAPIDEYNSAYYGGQMLSASKYDDCNQYNLVNTIPPHIKDNPQNDKYILFVEMIAQHFDGIWAYMDSITDINEAYSGLKDGISKDLVLNQLTSRGISAYDQFSNASLYEYLIGDDGTETFEYNPTDGSTLISASNAPIPKGDIAKEIWKRLYHNSSYLLKTKGTERGLKALIACYGIPETVLHVKEYGGPLVNKTGFRTFSYQKESKMVNRIGNKTNSSYSSLVRIISPFVKGSTRLRTNTNTPTSLQVRYLPDSNNKTQLQPIFTLSHQNGATLPDLGVLISQSLDTSKADSGSFAHLILVTGSSVENDITQNKVIASELVPFFNGDVWNISLTLDSGSSNNIKAYATNTTFNKNTYVVTCSLNAPEYFSDLDFTGSQIFVQPESNTLDFGAGNTHTVTGSFQEFRLWDELLTEKTIVTQSLSPFNYNGNTISSSYETLVARIPLGSDLYTPGDSLGVNLDLTDNINKAPNPNLINSGYNGTLFKISPGKYVSLEETHHLTTPDTVGSGMVSDKVRIDNGTFDDNFLDPFISVETSPQDRQPLDYSDLGVFFSPTFEVNEDIIYTLGGFRLDDYIGDPTHYTSGSYPDLKTIRDIYTQKLNKKLGIGDYIRTIQFFDHTLFKMIKEFVPAKANLKTGLVIEPHYLERMKIAGTNVDYEQLPEHLVNPGGLTGSISSTSEQVHDVFIDVVDYIDDGSYSTAVENVAQTNKKSRFYSLR
jgi:hypothetical protein